MLVNSNVLLRNILFIFLATYFLQGPLYPAGSFVSKFSLLVVLLISFYFFLRSVAQQQPKPIIFYALTSLVLLNFIGFLIGGKYNGIYFSQMKGIFTAILPFFAFFYLSKKGFLSEKHLLFFLCLMLPVVIVIFYYSQRMALLNTLSSSDNLVNNSSYLFVSLLPLIFFFGKRKVLALLVSLVLIYFIIQGAKRGAVVTGTLGLLVFLSYNLFGILKNNFFRGVLVLFFGSIAVIAFSIHFMEANQFLIQRMQSISNGGSGRNIIYINLLESWYNSNDVFNYLFGFGFVSTIDQGNTGNLAHNDWLELLTNFGVLGVLVYTVLFFGIAKYVFVSKVPRQYRIIMLAVGGMWFLQTMFSMYYTVTGTAITMAVFGYLASLDSGSKYSTSRFKK